MNIKKKEAKKVVYGNAETLAKEMFLLAKEYAEKCETFVLEYYITKIKYYADLGVQNLISYDTFADFIKEQNFVYADCKMFSVLRLAYFLRKFNIKNCHQVAIGFVFFGKGFDNISHVSVFVGATIYDDTNKVIRNLTEYCKKTNYSFSVFFPFKV